MKSNYDVLGNHLRLVDTRNKQLETDTVLGINIDKYFMPSVANIIGTDLSKYKLISKGLFACNPMHVGRDERLPVALYTHEEKALVSPAYFMFEIIDTEKLLPEYLMMWFKRPQFDRICWLKTDGSVRGGILWEDICRLEIPIPSKEKQTAIVKAYKTITDRIALKQQINDNLEATTQAYFDSLFFADEDTNIQLVDIAEINPDRSLSKGVLAKCYDMATLPTKGCVPSKAEVKPYNGGMRFKNGDTLLARITPCLENGKAAYINILDENEIAFGSTEYIVFSPQEGIPSSFFYFLVRNSKFVAFALQYMNGSSGRQRVSGSELGSFKLKKPTKEGLEAFDRLASKTLDAIKLDSVEIETLVTLLENLASNLSSS